MASKNGSLPLYQQIYDKIMEDVRAGRLNPGDRVPSENELSKRFGVSRITTKRTLEMLSEEGIVERVAGKGTFLREQDGGAGEALRRDSCNHLIGLVVTQFADEFGAILIRSIEAGCRELGYQVVLCITYESQKLEEEAIEKLLAMGVCGLIVLPVHGEFYNSIILKLILDKFPLVFIDRRLRGLEVSTVSSDNVSAAKAATDFLLRKGHRVIAFLSRQITNTSTLEDRLDGFYRSHIEAGVSIEMDKQVLELPVSFSVDLEGGGEGDTRAELPRICAFLKANPEITAIFAAECTLAMLAKKAARELGIQVEIVCFDEPYRPRYLPEERITCVIQPELLMGREAVRILQEYIEGDKNGIEVVLLEASLDVAQ
jgi:GntR family transcriptional regulator, arabinose operon transcriptional repressor